mgnify:CR=1 FL=1
MLEAQLDIGRGPVATVLVDKGTLNCGHPTVAGAAWGQVRALINDRGEQIKEAGPSTPVQVLGLSAVRGAAPVAQTLYADTPESIQAKDAYVVQRRFAKEPALSIEHGRPTKRDRRELQQAQHGWDDRWSASID